MEWSRDRAAGSRAARLASYATVSTSLAKHTDRQLRELVDAAAQLGSGIGGTAVRLGIDGVPVFVKRVPLTDLERRPENVMCTANLFQLPTFFQYGVGSAGFGVWRELAAHAMTTATSSSAVTPPVATLQGSRRGRPRPSRGTRRWPWS